MLPVQYRWLEAEPGPRMIVEALKEYGTLEAAGAADNPKIVGWQTELEAAGLGRVYAGVYRHDAIPWCGLFMAIVAHRANAERRSERNPPRLYLAALQWDSFGKAVPKGAAALGDVLVFKRKGGGWPADDKGQSTKPRDIGEHLTKAVRAVVKQNPQLSGVIDVVDFAAERNGERDINPAKLRLVVETFSDPRYRLGLADVQPDFLGRAYEYLLRKFAEGSGQSAGEFFTPTEVGFLMAHIMRPRPGEECHDFACGSAGLLVKLQLVARELDPTTKVPLKLTGQELQAESYAVAQMNGIIHDMEIEIARGDTMINPKFRTNEGKVRTHDIVVANPMWNQPFAPDVFANDPFDRFRTTGGVTTGKGDWAWLQHTFACLNDHGRAAVVLDTGAVTRGSGSKNEDKERNIRKWFVDHDLIDGVLLLPDNLFYNTTAAGVIVVLNKRKPAARKDKIVLLNASRRVQKGRPKNFIPEDHIRPLAAAFLKGDPLDGEVAIITRQQAEDTDYNLNPSRWVGQTDSVDRRPIKELVTELLRLDEQTWEIDASLAKMLVRL
jgi:type I restriction enzyme M protein